MGSVLKLDFDWIPPFAWMHNKEIMIVFYLKEYGISVMKTEVNFSCSGNGQHLIVYLDRDIDDEWLCMLQWLFGDDQTRAKLNYERVKAGVENWNKFFKRKVKIEKKP